MTTQAKILTLADAVVFHLNSQAFSQAFTAARKWFPTYHPNELETLTVAVVPHETRRERSTRDDWECVREIGIGVWKKLDVADGAADPMILLCEEIAASFEFGIDYYADGQVLEIRDGPIGNPDFWKEAHVFAALIVLTVRLT